MQKYKFKLETVLNHRAVLEEQAMQAFAEAQGHLAACTARIATMQLEFQQIASTRPKTFDVQELALRERHLDNLRSRIEQQEQTREALEARLEDARNDLVKSRRDRETVERLKEIDFEEHRKNVQKAEQDAIDELATMRHRRAGGER